MRHHKPKAVHLTEDAIKQVWASNHGAILDGTMGFALLYGKRRPRQTVVLLLAIDDSPKQRREKQRRIRTEGLVLLGHTHAVTETTVHRKNGHRVIFSLPPIGYLFLLRHRLGHHNKFYATTYDGNSATQVPIHHAK